MTPRGIRNSNPGNIELGSDKWQGLSADQTDGRFAQFDSPEYGIRAMAKVLGNYQVKHGLNTPREMIGRWAPAGENDVGSYAASVAKNSGLDPDAPIDLSRDGAALIAAMIQHENGQQPYDQATISKGIQMAGLSGNDGSNALVGAEAGDAPKRSAYFDSFLKNETEKPPSTPDTPTETIGRSPYFDSFLATEEPSRLTEGDDDSPIPNDLIEKGKGILAGDPPKKETPAFDAFVAKYHPDISAEEKSAMRTRMSNPARTGAAVADSFLPFSDEISAGIGASIRTVGKAFTDEDIDFGGDYDAGLEKMRAFQAAEDELQGLVDETIGITAAVGGGGAASIPKAGAKLLSSPTATGRLAKTVTASAGGGAAYEAGGGEGAADRAVKATGGVITGAVGGVAGNAVGELVSFAAKRYGPEIAKLLGAPDALTPDGSIAPATRAQLESAGVDPDEVTTTFAEEFAKRSDLPPGQAARAATFDTLGVRGTRGQITGDVTDQASEEAMRAGAQGGQPAANVMKQFDDTQKQGLDRARDDFAGSLGDGNVQASNPVEAADIAFQGVQRKADEAKAAAQVFYKESENAGVKIQPEAFDDLIAGIENRLANAEVIVDGGTPQANRMLEILRNRSSAAKRDKPFPVSLELVDKTRSRISTSLRDARRRGDTAEVEALSEILTGMDDWVDGAIDRAMFEGAPEGVEALKAARKLWTQYRKTFFGKKGADKFIAKMVQDEAGPRDVFGWLYSNGRMGAGKQSTQFARRLKGILGEDSAEWAALRQGAWAKLTKGVSNADGPGAQKIGQDIRKFLTGDTRSLAQTLFSADEIKQMQVYARGMSQTVPAQKATNPSGSGYEARRAAGAAFRRLVEMFGFAQGGLEGAVVGGAAARSVGTGGGWLQAKAATAGIRPDVNIVPRVAAGTLIGNEGRTAAEDWLGIR